MWQLHGRKASFEVVLSDWNSEYPSLEALIEDARMRGLLEAWPNNENKLEDGRPASIYIRLKPTTMEQLRNEPKKVHRQVIFDGEKFDLRSGINQELTFADIEDLAKVSIPCWVNNIKNDPDPGVRRASQRMLQRAIHLRGEELRRSYPEVVEAVRKALLVTWKPTQSE
jgi:hypothetical protein